MSDLEHERESWNSVADAWRRWWRVFEHGAQSVSDALVDCAGVGPGMRVLDFATGLGEPALTAAKAVGPRGSVLGIDLAERMIELARERAAEAGITNVAFEACDAGALAARGPFDAAVSRWGLMLVIDPADVVRRVRRLLAPGARFAAAVWAEPARVPFLATPRAALETVVELTPLDPDTPGPFRLCDPSALVGHLESAGFADVTLERISVTMRFATPADYTRFTSELSSTLRRLLGKLDAQTRRAALAAIDVAAAGFESDGELRFDNTCLIAVGTNP